MKKIIFLIASLISVGIHAEEGPVKNTVSAAERYDSCLFYKNNTCVLNEQQAIKNMEQEAEGICLANYKEKCILTKEQAKANLQKQKPRRNFRLVKRSDYPSRSSFNDRKMGSSTADLRARAILENRR